VLIYRALGVGMPAPSVQMTLADDSLFTVGPLVGGQANGDLLFALLSSEPFKAVSLGLGTGEVFRTDVVGFFNGPAQVTPVAEPSTLLLLAAGLLLSGRRFVRRARGTIRT